MYVLKFSWVLLEGICDVWIFENGLVLVGNDNGEI